MVPTGRMEQRGNRAAAIVQSAPRAAHLLHRGELRRDAPRRIVLLPLGACGPLHRITELRLDAHGARADVAHLGLEETKQDEFAAAPSTSRLPRPLVTSFYKRDGGIYT